MRITTGTFWRARPRHQWNLAGQVRTGLAALDTDLERKHLTQTDSVDQLLGVPRAWANTAEYPPDGPASLLAGVSRLELQVLLTFIRSMLA